MLGMTRLSLRVIIASMNPLQVDFLQLLVKVINYNTLKEVFTPNGSIQDSCTVKLNRLR